MEISRGEVVSNTDNRSFVASFFIQRIPNKKTSGIKEIYDGLREGKKSWTRFEDEERDESAISIINCSLLAKQELEYENLPVKCYLPDFVTTLFINFNLFKVSSSVEKVMTLYYFGPIYTYCCFYFSEPKASQRR